MKIEASLRLLAASSKLIKMYHGSPFSNVDFKHIKVIFLTADRKEAARYARSEVHLTGRWGDGIPSPTIYEVAVNVSHAFDMRKEQHKAAYSQMQVVYPDLELPNVRSIGFIQHTGLPGYGCVRDLRVPMLAQRFDCMWVDEGSQGISLAVFSSHAIKNFVIDTDKLT